MRGKLGVALVSACVLFVFGLTLVANAGTDIAAPEMFTVLGTTTKDRFIDVGKKNDFGSGDIIMFTEKLTDESDNSTVGRTRVECTIQIGSWAICTGTIDITGRGQIVGEGMVPLSDVDSFDFPITGGSGEFNNVRGEMHVEPISDTEERLTFDLLP